MQTKRPWESSRKHDNYIRNTVIKSRHHYEFHRTSHRRDDSEHSPQLSSQRWLQPWTGIHTCVELNTCWKLNQGAGQAARLLSRLPSLCVTAGWWCGEFALVSHGVHDSESFAVSCYLAFISHGKSAKWFKDQLPKCALNEEVCN